MRIIRSIPQMQRLTQRWRAHGTRIGFVPTMGAFHAGHLALFRRAQRHNDVVVVSVFVNPLQFGPAEDVRNYPRPVRQDRALARAAGVTVLFRPSPRPMYPQDFVTSVTVDRLTATLCGRARPGHFRGVTTVVLKLLQIIQPHRLYLGQKDAQQARVLRQMVVDLCVPTRVHVVPTVRESDGLAVSSRNAYLTSLQRGRATQLYCALCLGRRLIRQGTRDPRRVEQRMRALIRRQPGMRIDYVSLVDADTLTPARRLRGRCLLAVAVWVGRARLIDNFVVGV